MPYTSLIDWFLYPKRIVFTARYELSPYITQAHTLYHIAVWKTFISIAETFLARDGNAPNTLRSIYQK